MSTIQDILNKIKSTEGDRRYTPDVKIRERTSPVTQSKEYQDVANSYKWVMRQSFIDEWNKTIQQDRTNEWAINELNKRISYQWLSSSSPKELFLWTWITERQPAPTQWPDRPMSPMPIPEAQQPNVEQRSKSLLSHVASAPKEFLQSAWKHLWAAWDFWGRTAQQAISLFATLPSYATVSWAKVLWDKDLKNVSYDDLWKEQIKAATDRSIDIWRPTEYFESLITWETPEESRFLMNEAEALARNINSKIDSWDWWQAVWDILKLAWIWFMREFANPFWIAWNSKVYDKSFRLRNPKTLWSAKFSRWWDNLIWKSKNIVPEERVMKIEVKWAKPYYNEAWKRITPKQPEIYVIAERAKDWTVTVRAVNTWWEIYNPELVKAAVSEAWLPAVRWTQWAVSSLPQWATRAIPAAPAISRQALRLWEPAIATEPIRLTESSIKDKIQSIKSSQPQTTDTTVRPQEARREALEVKTPKVSEEKKQVKIEPNRASEVTKEPIIVYRWKWKWIWNSTLVNWEYYADTKEFASNFWEVTKSEIPKGSKIFNLDSIKEWTWEISKELLVDQKALTKYLIDKWYDYTVNTNTRWVEYVKLNKVENELWELASSSKDKATFREKVLKNWDKYREELNRLSPDSAKSNLPWYKSWIDIIWDKYWTKTSKAIAKDEIDIKFEKEKATWKTPAQIFKEKSDAAKAKREAKELEIKKKLEEAKKESKKKQDLTIRKKDIKQVEPKPKKEPKVEKPKTKDELVKSIDKSEKDMDMYEPWTNEWTKAAAEHLKLNEEFEALTWKSYLDYSLEQNIESISWRDNYIVDDDWGLVFYSKWKKNKLHEFVWRANEDIRDKDFKELMFELDRRSPEIEEKIMKYLSREKNFNIQSEVESAIRNLWLPITKTKAPWAAEYYTKGILAIRSIHDVPAVTHWVAHHFFNDKLPTLDKLDSSLVKEMVKYAWQKKLGKIDEWTLYRNKEVFPYFLEDVLKNPRIKSKFPNMYNSVFNKEWMLYDNKFIDFFKKMDEVLVVYEAIPDVMRAESLMFSWPKKESLKARWQRLLSKDTYSRMFNKTQQNMIDEAHASRVVDMDVASILWTKIWKNKLFIDSIDSDWVKYYSLHRLARMHDTMLRYAESNLKYNPKRKWTWIPNIEWKLEKISDASIGELNDSLSEKAKLWKEEWKWWINVTEESVRSEFGSLLISRRYVDFLNNKKRIENSLNKAADRYKEINDELDAIREVRAMWWDEKKLKDAMKKLKWERRDLKKYITSEKKWLKTMNKMLREDHMSVEERQWIVDELSRDYKEELSIYDRVVDAENEIMFREWILSRAEREAYKKQWWYTTFLRSTPEDFKAQSPYRKTWTDTTKIKELEWSEAAIVNPLDAMPYLHMETLKNFSKQRFYNELYKRRKFWIVTDIRWWEWATDIKWVYKAYIKWDDWEWLSKTFRTMDADNLLSDSIDSLFWIPSRTTWQEFLDIAFWRPASFFQKMTTSLNPYFALAKNIFIDIPTSVLFSRTWYVPFVSHISEAIKSMRSESYRKRFIDNFNEYAALWWIDMWKAQVDPRRVDSWKIIRNIVKSKWLRKSVREWNYPKIAKEIFRLIPRWVKWLSWLSETFTRFFEFQRAKEQWKNSIDAFEAARMVSWSFHRRWLITKKITKYAPYTNAQLQLLAQHVDAFAKIVKWDISKMSRLAMLIWITSSVAYLWIKKKIDNVKNAKNSEEYDEALLKLHEYIDKSVYKKSWSVFTWKEILWKELKIPMNPLFSTPWLLLWLKEINELLPYYEPNYSELAREWFWSFISWWFVPDDITSEWLFAKMVWLNPVTAVATNLAWYRTFPTLSAIENMSDKNLSPDSRYNEDTNRFAVWFAKNIYPDMSPKRLDLAIRSWGWSMSYIMANILWEMALTKDEEEVLWLTPYTTRELLVDKPLKSYLLEETKPFSWDTATRMYDRIDALTKHKKKLEWIQETKSKMLEEWVPLSTEEIDDMISLVEAYEETKESQSILNNVAEVTWMIRDWNKNWTLDEKLTPKMQNSVHRFLLSFLEWQLTDQAIDDYWISELIREYWKAEEKDKIKLFE